MRNSKIIAAAAVVLAMAASSAYSGTVSIPNTFTAGTPAKAADVNANFTAVASAVNSTAQDVSALQSTVKGIPAGGAAMAKDANGLTVGQYFPSIGSGEFVVMKTAAGQPVSLPINPAGFGFYLNGAPSGFVVFTSAKCTGTPYLAVINNPTSTVVPQGIVARSTVYVAGASTSVTYQSELAVDLNGYPYPQGQGAPTCVATALTTATVYSVTGTIDLSVYVLPFSVQ
jgi:hypothetical protein